MINKLEVEALKDRLGYKNAFGVSSVGRAGGLSLYWKEEVLFSLVSFSQHHICGDVEDKGKKWRFVGIYGWAKEEEKHFTWSLLRHLCVESPLPIIVGGDFNEILCYSEKEGGADRVRREMTGFRDTMDFLGLRDLGYTGHWHTWERGKSANTCIRERLDRFGLGPNNAGKFTKLDKQIGEAERKLAAAQQQAITDENCQLCVDLEKSLDELHEKREAYWYLRSRVAEVRDGDRNTSYFHHKASQRRKRNYVHGLFGNDGVWREDACDIEAIFAEYFASIFTSTNPSDSAFHEVLKFVEPVVTADCNRELLQPFTKDEVFAALQQMHPCKAPGPDGMHAILYQHFWHIVGDDVTHFVSNILHGNSSPSCINSTNIALIPKVKNPTKASEFRPIALCNVLYKLVSKAIVLRLQAFLPMIVSETQSAFVPGRLITDNALIAMELFHTMKHRNKSRKGIIAMKLDMSKAYDRVEWGFLRKLLLTMGFDGRWVNLIMQCVSSVNYSFIINGGVCGSVTPARGLRQGDPLSSYLFILIAYAFSRMIQRNVQDKRLHGAKASRSGPEISHLLFADDSLLFTRATRQECAVEKHEKYLGIPSISGRSKRAVFDSLLDRIWKKLQGWKEKYLSRAGKEILLKSVIQAIPTYLMGVYKLPCSVTQKIHSAMAQFWWGSSATQRKTHWKNWDAMCSLKCLGGMGFKDLRVFNDALLGRQAWRLVREPHSLMARVMKAKYYPNHEFLDAYLGTSVSYSWKSIWSSKALLKEGVVWRVGTGANIHIWEDPWVVDEEGRFITSTPTAGLSMVSDLVDVDRMDWKVEVVEAAFNERDTRCILATPLGNGELKDELTWALTKDGVYSVKTAYMLGKGLNLDDFHNAWVDIWSLEASPKVRNFLWRLCTNSLPVRSLLKHRHVIDDDICPRGCGETETPAHAIFGCPHIADLWAASGCAALCHGSNTHTMCDLILSWREIDRATKIKGVFLAWSIWGERNNVVFNNKHTPPRVLLDRAKRNAEDFGSYAKRIYPAWPQITPRSSRIWLAPPAGFTKLNVDASLAVDGWVGLGVVARQADGEVLFAATRRIRAHWSPEVAEAKAILMAVRLSKRYGFQEIILESDCQLVINKLLKNALRLSDLDSILHDILSSSVGFKSISWSHVRRDGNFVAHHLARLFPFGIEQIWENHCPLEVAPYVLLDKLSLE
ncbi:uncharacterized protein LOC125498565 [Beta vulgaris subsp. vulgaris]|uniref:uncharacterized protein LOC125498565 n=1 Tax=Beta vulgaris subsp. vulgaris TaxID=3555 RepID=UPI002036E16E|nr:uncharacterized protein LOC125498565 [Beta vulgaris subsp. vulgaris]